MFMDIFGVIVGFAVWIGGWYLLYRLIRRIYEVNFKKSE